jgi:hypothetical protein
VALPSQGNENDGDNGEDTLGEVSQTERTNEDSFDEPQPFAATFAGFLSIFRRGS